MLSLKYGKVVFGMVVFIISLVVGCGVRLYYGFNTDLWGDEAISYFIARDNSWFDLIFSTGKYWDFVHPPLSYIYFKIGLLFGDQDWWLRFLALIWFIPSLFLVNEVGKKIGDKNTGLLAMSLFALHPLCSGLAFQVRPYPVVIFIMLLFLNLFVEQLQRKSEHKEWLLGLILAASFYADYAAVWLVFGLILFAVWLWAIDENELLGFILRILIFFAAFAAYQISVLARLLVTFEGNVIAGSVNYFNLPYFFQELNFISGFGVATLSATIMLVICFLIAKRKNIIVNQFLIITIFGSLALSIIYSLWLQPIFLGKNLVIATISLIFVMAQFQQNIKNHIMTMLILLFYGYYSVSGYGFLYSVDLDKQIKDLQISDSDVVVSFVNYLHNVSYYLETNNSFPEIMPVNRLTFRDQDRLITQNKIILLTDFCEYTLDESYNCIDRLRKFEQEFCIDQICQKMNF